MAEMMLGFECPYGLVDNYADCENVNKPECVKCRDKTKLIGDTMNGLFIGKWISVEDRLPDRTCCVLCACRELIPEFYLFHWIELLWFENGHWWYSIETLNNDYSKYVTHWMPVPELPKEDV